MRIALWLSLLLIVGPIEVRAQERVSAHIVGRVTNSSGEPLAGVKVLWNWAEGYVDVDKPTDTRTDASGRYDLVVGFTKNEPVTIKEVFADLDGYGAANRPETSPCAAATRRRLIFAWRKGKCWAAHSSCPDCLWISIHQRGCSLSMGQI